MEVSWCGGFPVGDSGVTWENFYFCVFWIAVFVVQQVAHVDCGRNAGQPR
jgi:hypothetical protein